MEHQGKGPFRLGKWPCVMQVNSIGERLNADDVAKFLYGSCTPFQRGIFFGSELDLHDLLDAMGAQFAEDADKVSADAVLAFKVSRARQDLLLVLENGFSHLHRARRRRIV